MKTTIISMLSAALLLVTGGCHQPDELLPATSRKGINSITASFVDKAGKAYGEFKGQPAEGSNEIVIAIPYYYPESSDDQVTSEMLQKMRVKGNLDNNVTVTPSLLFMDLSQDNYITVTDQLKQKTQYTVRGVVTKSSECEIKKFEFKSVQVEGVFAETDISLPTFEDLTTLKADLELSYHATISPDPRTQTFDYKKGVKFTVTAHDGTTKVYNVKQTDPKKLAKGFRAGSAKLLWSKKVIDLGGVSNMTTGIAVSKKYVVMHTRAANTVVLDPMTGEKIKDFSLGAIQGSLTAFYNTVDEDGNVLLTRLSANAGACRMYKFTVDNPTPEVFIDWTTSGSTAIGRKVSVRGSLTGNAVITAPIHAAGLKFARWQVVGGVLKSHEPELVTITGLKDWANSCDIVSSSALDPAADYFVTSSSGRQVAWVNGATNAVRSATIDGYASEANPPIFNDIDYTVFNGTPYVLADGVSPNGVVAYDQVFMIDASSPGNFAKPVKEAAVWYSPGGLYGGGNNGNATADIAFMQTDNEFYLYVYMMFTNGSVACYQLDCIDLN